MEFSAPLYIFFSGRGGDLTCLLFVTDQRNLNKVKLQNFLSNKNYVDSYQFL